MGHAHIALISKDYCSPLRYRNATGIPSCTVGEAVDAGDAHVGEALGGSVGGCLVVVAGDKGHADCDMFGTDKGKQQREVVPGALAIAAGVSTIGVGVALFDVDDEVTYHFGGLRLAPAARSRR